MNEYADILRKAAEQPDTLSDSDIDALKRACSEYPADAVAPALLLKYGGANLNAEELAFARARVSLYTGHPATLIAAIDPSGKGFDTFYPPLPADKRPSTVNAIDIFLETYGKQSAEENALLERMIFNPVPDYAEQLARETKQSSAPKDSQDERIDAFIAAHPLSAQEEEEPLQATVTQEKNPEKQTPDLTSSKARAKGSANKMASSPSLLSQSLAKIFIKQGRYERAYEIISNLSLNYPEKSVYFADQLRFLEKLIINQRYSNRES